MAIPGEDLPGVMTGLDLLARMARNDTPDLGDTVVVFGGGNTAMDAARSAIRLGSKKVVVAYRRTRTEMPAEDAEIEEALEEGVEMMFLTAPMSINRENGSLTLRCMKMELGEPDGTGRRRPVPVEGSEFNLVCSTVVSAIGQIVDNECIARDDLTTKRGTVLTNPGTTETSIPGVFSGGDCVSGPDIAIGAIGAGKRAALQIDEYLRTGKCTPASEPYNCSKGHWRTIPRTSTDGSPRWKDWMCPASRPRSGRQASRSRRTHGTARVRCRRPRDASPAGARSATPASSEATPANTASSSISRHRRAPSPSTRTTPSSYVIREMHPLRPVPQICREMEGSSALSFYETDNVLTIGPNDHRPLDMTVCVACGHCATACPTGALSFKPVIPRIYRPFTTRTSPLSPR
jgi:formate dehydrogenase major subunit